MLSPWDFTVGTIAQAEGLTLVQPRDRGDEEFLVAAVGGHKTAILLDPAHEFDSWECSDAHNHKGILINDVQVEVDEKTAFDTQRTYAPYGALVRRGSLISVAAAARDGHGIRRQHLIPLIDGLPTSGSDTEVGFLKWQLVIGEGDTRRVLKSFEAEPAKGPPR